MVILGYSRVLGCSEVGYPKLYCIWPESTHVPTHLVLSDRKVHMTLLTWSYLFLFDQLIIKNIWKSAFKYELGICATFNPLTTATIWSEVHAFTVRSLILPMFSSFLQAIGQNVDWWLLFFFTSYQESFLSSISIAFYQVAVCQNFCTV